MLRESDRDYVMIVGSSCIQLVKVDGRGEQRLVLSWLLQNVKSYESRPLEQNPTQKMLCIDTGRFVKELMQTSLKYRHHGFNTDVSLIQTSLQYRHLSNTDIFLIQSSLKYRHLSNTDISLKQTSLKYRHLFNIDISLTQTSL